MIDGKTIMEIKESDFKPPYIILDKTMYYAERTLGDTSKKITLFYKPL
jgi:hypothetical protein